MEKTVDYLIVGQGIAGSIFAQQLLLKKKSFLLIDEGYQNSSSFVAAGMMNPLVLKRLTKTWRASEFLNYNHDFYSHLNEFLEEEVYREMSLKKLISSDSELSFWKKKLSEEDLNSYLSSELPLLNMPEQFTKEFQVGGVKQCSWLNIKPFLAKMRSILQQKNLLIQEHFDYLNLVLDNDRVIYNSVSAKKIVFCEGSKIGNNPYFNYLPMGLNKGELLVLRIPDYNYPNPVKKGIFILPVGGDLYRVGASYAWQWESEEPSEAKKDELLKNFEEICKLPYEVISHEAGIRPSVRDRRPLLGQHPDNKAILLFNGLGSRGCFMAPLLAKELINYSEEEIPLNPECDLNRFKRD